MTIRTLYVVNHSHTDIGFTDYQDVCFRQHAEFIERALDLCEATADYPAEAQYRWTCEVTGTTERYLHGASSTQIDRFLKWHRRGAIDIGGMQYNLTPMLTVEQMIRSLYPVRRLYEQYGVEIHSALQCDVNGISWLFADLLPQLGIDFLTMAINPIRGGAPQPRPAPFWWEGPGGHRILVWNGYHYLFGRSIAKLGDWRFVDRFLPEIIQKLEANGYPYDFLYCQATHPVRVDNGPPDPRMPQFVRKWNESGRSPRLEFTTPTAFARLLREKVADNLQTMRGDWTDWWADGVASSAYETGISRSTHEVMAQAETAGSWLKQTGGMEWSTERMAYIYEQSTLYDEHTWGSFASIAAPEEWWTRAQWNRKAHFVYSASGEAQDVLARAAHAFASQVAESGPEGLFNLGDLTPEEAYPASGAEHILVLNTLPWERTILVEEPEIRGQAAPAGVLDAFFPRDVPWGGDRPPTPLRRVSGTVPAMGYAFLPLENAPTADDLAVGEHTIENAHYRVRIDPTTGAIAEWYDKELDHDFAGAYGGWHLGQYVYERVELDNDRDALFAANFAHPEFGVGRTDTPFQRTGAKGVTVHPPCIEQGRASIVVEIAAPGIASGKCTISLDSKRKTLNVDWLLNKVHETSPEAVFVAFPFQLGTPQFRIDLNGIPCTPNSDQLPGTVRDWYPIGRWVNVSDGNRGVTIVPVDAPLVHLGGITTGRWATELEPESPTVMSWALHNHWMVNFKASQGGSIPLRYRLTTHAGVSDDTTAAKFAANEVTPPVVLRDYIPRAELSGQFVHIPDVEQVLVWTKPAENGDGIILRLQNLRPEAQSVQVQFDLFHPTSLSLTSPVEQDGDPIALNNNSATIPLAPMAVQSVRIRL